MRAIMLMFDSLNRHMLNPYVAETMVKAPNFQRLAQRSVRLTNFYAGSLPCMPARRELHTGRHNFLHRSWGPLEPFDDSMPQLLDDAGVHTHLASDHHHYWEDGGATYHTRYSTWEGFRGQENDPWRGVVGPAQQNRQNVLNRQAMPTEAEHSQTRTVDAGIEFLRANAEADRWFLQLELFDPHEPFFAHQHYRDRYGQHTDDVGFDWPPYEKVTEAGAHVAEARRHYAALVSMCDHSLGRVLDAMDTHDLWEDTMLIVNTDHGYLLGEHGWWAKAMMPWYNELVHLPFFLWDPRVGRAGTACDALAQTIDIAPTLLTWFGENPPPDMVGQDLGEVLAQDGSPSGFTHGHEAVLFGSHGGHVNVTDGRYVYMRSSVERENQPLEEFTLMPTRMMSRFGVSELSDWEPAEPFSFTKGLRTMRVPAAASWVSSWQHGTLLFDLATDPGQQHPLCDETLELGMVKLLLERLRHHDAPGSQFDRLGLPRHGPPGPEHLLCRRHAERAAAVAEPLPAAADLPGRHWLAAPVEALTGDPGARAILRETLPEVLGTELVHARAGVSLLDLARTGTLTRERLITAGHALATLD
ncbi:sulfatase [Ruania alba]|uniref:Arylsulfatase A n=1 Tax=Ruania alba TaxID=648782 RepID=A0A1H5LL98_9MICO|nr:sulfatase [Ruania alba]SEE77822.1 Arylsulfatase A [Ruania alba]